MSCEDRELCLIEGLLMVLRVRSGSPYQIICRPDKQNRTSEDCDVIAKLGDCEFAIEHTSIQSISNQRTEDEHLRKALGPLENELSGKMPKSGRFDLRINYKAKLTGIKWKELRCRIKDWCLRIADELELEPPKHYRKDTLEGVPFELCLYRERVANPKFDGKFYINRFAPENPELDLNKELYKALFHGEKVTNYRSKGYKTILLFESGTYDISSTTHQDIHNALNKVLPDFPRDQLPDEIYLAMSTGTEEWWFYHLHFNGFVEILGVWNSSTNSVILRNDPEEEND
jgi:hypothetical protein